jgi:hypothetical protein
MEHLHIEWEITDAEREKLKIALSVLRTGTEYADFLQWWLLDVGLKSLSPNSPPLQLAPWPSDEREDLLIFGPFSTLIQ